MAETVTVKLSGSFGYTNPEDRSFRYYGPGVVEVPLGLARALGLAPMYPEATAAKPAPKEQPLPAEFPHVEVLEGHGIKTYEAVPRTQEGLTALSGIGPKRAEDILQALED